MQPVCGFHAGRRENMKGLKALVLIVLVCAFALAQAQQPAAQRGQAGARGGQRGTPPPPDPRDMGGGRCAENPVNCKDAARPITVMSRSVRLAKLTNLTSIAIFRLAARNSVPDPEFQNCRRQSSEGSLPMVMITQ